MAELEVRERLKRDCARAALERILPAFGPQTIVGVGTGSTANHFIDALAEVKRSFAATVASSDATATRLGEHGIRVLDLTDAERVAVYVDGADEVAPDRSLIKGGGGALTWEKIVAAKAERFLCIVDDSKMVEHLGQFPLPIEVVPMASRLVAERLTGLGGTPRLREGFVTDNGNPILDVHGLAIDDAAALEATINNIPGVVTNGIFAIRRPEAVIVASPRGIEVVA